MYLLLLLSIVFIGVGAGTIWKQAQAKSCPAHSRGAGRMAVVIAFLSMATGVALLMFALLALVLPK